MEEVSLEISEEPKTLLVKLLNENGEVVMEFAQDKKSFNMGSIKRMAEKFGMKIKDMF